MPDQNLLGTLLQKAQTIGPPQIGDKLGLTDNPSLWDYVKSFLGGQRPHSIAAQDPYGISAWEQGKGPIPMMMGTTEGVDPSNVGIPGLWSRLTKAAQALPEQMHPSKALSLLQNAASKDEMNWRGIPDFIKGFGNKPIQKSEILGHLEQNPLKVETKVLGEPNPRLKIVPTSSLSNLPDYYDKPLHEVSPYTVVNGRGDPLSHHATLANAQDSIAEFSKMGPDPTQYQRWTTPGGKNYRESLIKLPYEAQKTPSEGAQELFGRDFYGLPESDREKVLQHIGYYETAKNPPYQSGHFGDEGKNLLVHTLHSDREMPSLGGTREVPTGQTNYNLVGPDGIALPARQISNHEAYRIRQSIPTMEVGGHKIQLTPHMMEEPIPGPKGRFIDELQSDWHTAGAQQGYQLPSAQKAQLEAEYQKLVFQNNAHRDKIAAQVREQLVPHGEPWSDPSLGYRLTEQMLKNDPEFTSNVTRGKELESLLNKADHGVPDAPFKDDWHSLALKQQLLDVAGKPDLEWLGMNKGSTIADRYNLARHISSVEYSPSSEAFRAYDRTGENSTGLQYLTPAELEQHIGREYAQQLLHNPTTKIPNKDDLGGFTHSLNFPEDLIMGGEGKRRLYDERFKNTLSKLVKPFGGTVEHAELPTGEKIQPNYGSTFNPGTQTHEVYDPTKTPVGFSGQPRDAAIASVYPKTGPEVVNSVMSPQYEDPGNGPTAYERVGHLMNYLNKQNTRDKVIPIWKTNLTPEMKQQILQKGFPALTSLLMLKQLEQQRGGDLNAR